MSQKTPVSSFVFKGIVCYWTISSSQIVWDLNCVRITSFSGPCACLYLHLWSRKLDHTLPYLALSCETLISKPFNHARLCDCFVTQMYSYQGLGFVVLKLSFQQSVCRYRIALKNLNMDLSENTDKYLRKRRLLFIYFCYTTPYLSQNK